MFKLRIAYFISGIAIGCILLFNFLLTLPDGKLHLVFCGVGQGDAAYIRFPDGRDMLVDGGPNDKVLGCLGRHMPFWDKEIDMVVLTHPQKDHLQGLISVLERYSVKYFLKSDIGSETEGYQTLAALIKDKKIPFKLVSRGEEITAGSTKIAVIWPSQTQLASAQTNILGASTDVNPNDYSVVFVLSYGNFNALFPGDADNHINGQFINTSLADEDLEVLKVPHHGSKTGMNKAMLDWLYPDSSQEKYSNCNTLTIEQFNNNSCSLAVISVGNNSYGHPSTEILKMLEDKGIKTLRTDKEGDIEITSDGKKWSIVD